MSSKLIVLVDGKNIAYRMHYSHLGLQTQEKFPTGMLHGFLYNLLRLHKKAPEARFIFCWDGASPTWRHNLQKGYKSNRKVNPEFPRMQQQLSVLEPMLDGLGFHNIKIDGVECDDLMGILAKGLAEDGHLVRFHSMDSDLYQLLTIKGISIWEKFDTLPFGAIEVEKKKGIAPKDWVLVQAMAGGHNNLKGLWLVGPVKAFDLYAAGARPDKPWAQQPFLIQTALARHQGDWSRIQQEYNMATIVTDVEADVWTENQKSRLRKSVQEVLLRPERRAKHTQEMEKLFYHFLGCYELEELFKERSLFWKLP